VRLFVEGRTFSEMAFEARVAKSTAHKEAQRFIELAEARGVENAALDYGVHDEILALRSLSVELNRYGVAVPTVMRHLSSCSVLESLGVGYSRIPSFVDMMFKVRTAAAVRRYLDVALQVSDIEEETGAGPRKIAEEYASTAAEVIGLRGERATLQSAIRSLNRGYQYKKERLDREFEDCVKIHEFTMEKMRQLVNLKSQLEKYGVSLPKKAELVGNVLRQLEALGGDPQRLIGLVESYGRLEQGVAAMREEENQARTQLEGLGLQVKQAEGKLVEEWETHRQFNQENMKLSAAIEIDGAEAERLGLEVSEAKEKLSQTMNEAEDIASQVIAAKAITQFLASKGPADYDFKEFHKRIEWIKGIGEGRGFPLTRSDLPWLEDKARKMLAELCLPLIKDEYVFKRVHELAGKMHKLELQLRDSEIRDLREKLKTDLDDDSSHPALQHEGEAGRPS